MSESKRNKRQDTILLVLSTTTRWKRLYRLTWELKYDQQNLTSHFALNAKMVSNSQMIFFRFIIHFNSQGINVSNGQSTFHPRHREGNGGLRAVSNNPDHFCLPVLPRSPLHRLHGGVKNSPQLQASRNQLQHRTQSTLPQTSNITGARVCLVRNKIH